MDDCLARWKTERIVKANKSQRLKHLWQSELLIGFALAFHVSVCMYIYVGLLPKRPACEWACLGSFPVWLIFLHAAIDMEQMWFISWNLSKKNVFLFVHSSRIVVYLGRRKMACAIYFGSFCKRPTRCVNQNSTSVFRRMISSHCASCLLSVMEQHHYDGVQAVWYLGGS